MAESVNRVVLLGTIGKYGMQMRFAPTGAACAAFSLVLTEKTQDGRHFSTVVPCEVWGKHAEAAADLQPGQLCVFEGKVSRKKKGEIWEFCVAGFDVTPIVAAAEAVAP